MQKSLLHFTIFLSADAKIDTISLFLNIYRQQCWFVFQNMLFALQNKPLSSLQLYQKQTDESKNISQ